MNDDLRWGILGTGNIAAQFVDDLVGNGHLVSAVGSRSGVKADAFARRKGIGRAHGSYQELVADPQVDIVYVATPTSVHFENAGDALRAGKHVLLEKPFTVDAAQARALVALADHHDRVLLEALWTRFLPHSVRLRTIIRSGAIGDVRAIIADTAQLLPSTPDFRLNRADLAGGALLDLGIYPISLAFDLIGAPQTTHAVATMAETGVDAQTSVLLTYPDGAHVYGHAAINAVGDNGATVLGSRGRVELDPIFYTATSFTVYDAAGVVTERFEEPESLRGMHHQAVEIERMVRAGERRSPFVTLEESVAMMDVLDAARGCIGLTWDGLR